MPQTEKQEDWQDVQTVGILTGDDKKELNRNRHLFLMFTLSNLGITGRGAATDSGPPGQHIHSGPPAFRGWGGGGGCMAGDTEGYPPP